MKQTEKKFARALLVALVLGQCAMQAQSKGDEDAVRNIPQAFAAAWAKHDGHQLGKLMAEDVDFVTVGADWIHGRPDFEAYHSRLLSTRFKDAALTVGEVKVRFLRPDLAVLHWSWVVKGDRNEDMSPRKPRTGLMTMIVERQGPKNLLTEATRKDKDWLVEVAQNTDWMPGPVPELDGINPPIVFSGVDEKPTDKPLETPQANQFTPAPLATPSATPQPAAQPSEANTFTPAPLATPSANPQPAQPAESPNAFTPAPLATPSTAPPPPPAEAPNTFTPAPLASPPATTPAPPAK